MSKLKNIKAVSQMAEGTHKSQTRTLVGFEKELVSRKVGDIWIDENGIEWEQKEGYKINHHPLDQLRKELQKAKNCPKPADSLCSFGKNRLDKKYNIIHGMCMDCALKVEDKMRGDGTWKDFQETKIKQNVLSWLYDTEQQVAQMKVDISTKPSFVHENGRVDTWNHTYNPEILCKNIDKEWIRVKTEILTNHGMNDEAYSDFKRDKRVHSN